MYKCEFWAKNNHDEDSFNLLCDVEIPHIPLIGDKFQLSDMMEGVYIVTEVKKELWISEYNKNADFLIAVFGDVIQESEQVTLEV